jgi:predicted Na+-dependent transporter
MVKSFGWCNMKKGGVDNKNIHSAVFSASIFAIIFILSDIIKEELNKHDLEDRHLMIINFLIHFFLIILVTWFVIFVFKTIYNIGNLVNRC